MGLFDWFRKRKPAPPQSVPASSPPAPFQPVGGEVGSAFGPPAAQPTVRPALATAGAPPATRRDQALSLDLGQFAQLSADDVRRRAGGVGSLWGNAWFGRRDLIPPSADPRTALIDRAMVGQGLITPEELAEIHAVGEQMEQVRPDLATATVRADEALRRTREERAALKQRKKAEAAERKRRHAEDVAARRRSDIVFLGRGVSSQLHDRQADVERLAVAGLPVFSTPADVAAALDLGIPRLRWLAFHSEAATVTHYVRFTVPKKSGGVRQLSTPHRDLAAAQQWVLANVLSKVPVHPAAHGFVPGRSTVTNAAPHVRRRIVVNADLSDFFPAITFPRVRGIFQQLGYSPAVATVLALLCTESPRRTVAYAGKPFHVAAGPRSLPQGACTSPALSNLATRRFDSRLAGISGKLGWTYTRYADDLTFSVGEAEGADATIGYLLARVRHIAQDEGFAVNEKKTRVQRPSAAQTVTGIVVNERPGVPREVARRMRAILHSAKSEGLAAQNREDHPHFEAWVRGMVGYISMVNPKQGEPLRRALAALANA